MADNTGSIRGLSGIVTAANLICKLSAAFGSIIRPALDPAVQPLWDALIAACTAFGVAYHAHPDV